MKRILTTITALFVCTQMLANELPLEERIRLDAEKWAQQVKTLELKEQESLAKLVKLSIETMEACQQFRKFMAGFLTTTQTVCENGLLNKEQTTTTMDMTKLSIALLKSAEFYRTTFTKWENLINQFEQGDGFSQKCLDLYEQHRINGQKHVLAYLENKKTTTENLTTKYGQLLATITQEMTTKLQNIYSYLDEAVDSIEENQQTLFKINMTSLAANIMLEKSFAGLQTSLQANKPKEIIQQASLSIFEIYLDALKKNTDVDFENLPN